jgi:molybdopterin synthase catalytic subunit
MYLTRGPIDLAAFLGEARPSDGAVCAFIGVVRNESEGRESVAIEYEAYEPMAESELAHIVTSLPFVWPGTVTRIRHRIGRLEVGEASVAIVTTAPHRDAAFAACRQAIENIKEWVPIWKREIRADGSSEWVAPKHLDTIAGR